MHVARSWINFCHALHLKQNFYYLFIFHNIPTDLILKYLPINIITGLASGSTMIKVGQQAMDNWLHQVALESLTTGCLIPYLILKQKYKLSFPNPRVAMEYFVIFCQPFHSISDIVIEFFIFKFRRMNSNDWEIICWFSKLLFCSL